MLTDDNLFGPIAQTLLRLDPQSKVSENLELAARLFAERNAVYQSNYQRQGAALLALFPPGGLPAITDERLATRLSIINACVNKLQRYCHNFENGGHADSAQDLTVFAAMLSEYTDAP